MKHVQIIHGHGSPLCWVIVGLMQIYAAFKWNSYSNGGHIFESQVQCTACLAFKCIELGVGFLLSVIIWLYNIYSGGETKERIRGDRETSRVQRARERGYRKGLLFSNHSELRSTHRKLVLIKVIQHLWHWVGNCPTSYWSDCYEWHNRNAHLKGACAVYVPE